MRKYFLINGYWKDNKESFDGLMVTNFDDVEEGGDVAEEDIFFFGLGESHIKEAIELGEETSHDFVIQSYETLN
jgi:hypothetical protein